MRGLALFKIKKKLRTCVWDLERKKDTGKSVERENESSLEWVRNNSCVHCSLCSLCSPYFT
jgi:hypothetical protein